MNDAIRNNQSNEYLCVTQNPREFRQKLYNEAKFVGVMVRDVVEKYKSKKNVFYLQKNHILFTEKTYLIYRKNISSLSFILYFHNSISVSDSQF